MRPGSSAATAADPFVVGVRRNVQNEARRLHRDAGLPRRGAPAGRGRTALRRVRARHQLPELIELARACPGPTIVLDHLGKPSPPGRHVVAASLRRLARLRQRRLQALRPGHRGRPGHPRACTWSPRCARPCEVFGPERCLYGSDWPVMTLATDYESWLDTGPCRTRRAPAAAAVDAVLTDNRGYLDSTCTGSCPCPHPPRPHKETA